MPKLWLTIGGYAGCALLFLLWRVEVNDHRASLAEAETDKALSIAAAEQATRETLSEAHQRELDQQRQLTENAENARLRLSQEVSGLETAVSEHASTISRLEMEASIDEIPDFADCSIVYIPSRVLYAEDCGEAGAGGDYDYRVCVGAEGLNEADSAFSNITTGDALKLWQQDRTALGRCNAQLAAIESLGVSDAN